MVWAADEPNASLAPEPSNEAEFQQGIHSAYIEVAKAKLDRTNAATTFVTTAAGTIGTIYAALLGLVFSIETTPARPLPLRGIAPAIFLALAFVLSAARGGFLRTTARNVPYKGTPPPTARRRAIEEAPHLINPASSWQEQEERLLAFLQWMERGAMKQAWAARVAIVCLGAAVFLLPLPFLDMSAWTAAVLIVAVSAVVLAYLAYEVVPLIKAAINDRRRSEPSKPSEPGPDLPAPDAPPGKRT
jgi:hypothetical protein